MQQLEILTNALEYIEKNLAAPIKTEEVATSCYCSKTSLENIFRSLQNISVHDYITRRRMTLAGRELFVHPNKRIIDIAMDFGYTSNEAFTRSFYQVWNCTPSEFRKKDHFAELFPKYVSYVQVGDGGIQMERKNVDISELYDLFAERKDCYLVYCDIRFLMRINDISRKAGDLAILEALNRMNAAASQEDYVFRIGADEFVMLTGSRDAAYAEHIVQKLLAQNGQPINYEGQEIPVTLYVGLMQSEQHFVCYWNLLNELYGKMLEKKKEMEEK